MNDNAETKIEVTEAAETLAAILARNGVTELFVMPGDAFAVLEAIAKLDDEGVAVPRVILCPHEVVALAAAHGHFMVSGRPQACLFHVDVGLQMAGGMLHNAQRARAGVVIFSGRAPLGTDGEGGVARVIDVHWMQDRPDQAGMVRDYVKWHADLTRAQAVPLTVQRALQVAASEPAGPVYVSLGLEMLREGGGEVVLPDPARHAPPRPPAPDRDGLAEAARMLAEASMPVAIAGAVGRRAEGFHALTDFAERAAVPVISRGGHANISSASPMALGSEPGTILAEADLLLLLDVDVPYIPLFGAPDPAAKVIQIDIDPVKADIPLWGFPVDLALQADTSRALPALGDLLDGGGALDAERLAGRRARLASLRAELIAKRGREADAGVGAAPMSVAYVAREVARLVDDRTIVVDDSTTAISTTREHIPTTVPGSYFQPIGSSMGWGSGAALGAKLASPQSTVINLNAEGNFVSGVPEAMLWAAVNAEAPFLIVVFNNSQYAAIKLGMAFSYPDSHALRAGTAIDFRSPPDFAAIATACGCHGERVADPADLPGALRRGLDAVRDGRPAVVDVEVAAP